MSTALQPRLTERELDAHNRDFRDIEPGIVALTPSREAWWTGRVLIGKRHGEAQAPAARTVDWSRQPAMSADAEKLQRVLIDKRPDPRWTPELVIGWISTVGIVGVVVAIKAGWL